MDNLYVATPMYAGQCTAGYTSSLLNLSSIMSFQHMFITNESLITRARNMLADTFLKSGCDYMLFVDADVAFDAQGIQKMIESDCDVIGGLYAKKIIDWGKVYTAALRGTGPQQLPQVASDPYVCGRVSRSSSRPTEVESIGTGLMLIKRRVFEKMMPATRKAKLGSDLVGSISADEEIYHFFESGFDEKTGVFLSEDYQFCQKWRGLGGKVHAAPWIKTVHIGTYHFV